MRARRRWIVLLLVLVVLLVGGRWGLGWLKLYGPGILAGWLDPIGPTRQVAWQAGPEAPAAPPASRPPNVVVIVADGFKLQVAERPAKSWLFDLRSDPTEKVNLAERDPERVRRLEALLAAHDAEMRPPAWPALIEGPVAIDHPLGVPDGADDEYVYWAN